MTNATQLQTGKRTISALIGSLIFVAFGALPVHAGIANTKHNLSSGAPAGNNKVSVGDTAEICVFCHTPHAADITAPAPLWNKRLTTGAAYTTYANLNSSSIDGEILSVGSISVACLSCHDGAQAMDNIINAPGSGGYDVTGGGSLGLGYTWSVATTRVDADGKMLNSGTSLSMLGPDLSNDHPIGIKYCGGGPTNAAPATACVDTDFTAPSSGVINSNTVFWVDVTGGTAARNKTDMQLYTRTFGTGAGPSVECGSCHDPHVEAGQVSGTLPAAGQTFLRVANTGSAVCLACHVK